jgi:hypothetical protein
VVVEREVAVAVGVAAGGSDVGWVDNIAVDKEDLFTC